MRMPLARFRPIGHRCLAYRPRKVAGFAARWPRPARVAVDGRVARYRSHAAAPSTWPRGITTPPFFSRYFKCGDDFQARFYGHCSSAQSMPLPLLFAMPFLGLLASATSRSSHGFCREVAMKPSPASGRLIPPLARDFRHITGEACAFSCRHRC